MRNNKGIIFAALIFSTAISTYLYGYSTYCLNNPFEKTNHDVKSDIARNDVGQEIRTKPPMYHKAQTPSEDRKNEAESASDDLQKLSAEIRAKILERQNPVNCDKARLLVYDINWWKCGFGCTTHVMLQHILLAFYTNRTFVLKSDGWIYDSKGWDHYFMPLGKCDFKGVVSSLPVLSDKSSSIRIVRSADKDLAVAYNWRVPRNILSKVEQNNHTAPFAWYVGQFINYQLRVRPWLKAVLAEWSKKAPTTDFTVGLHIRWGDKIGIDALKHPVTEYVDLASKWFERPENQCLNKTVYVATEQSEAWKDLEDNFHDFSFFGSGYVNRNKELDHRKGANYAERKNELDAIFADIYFLSKCQYIVCTFSSNICRLLYELMATQHRNPEDSLQSLDAKFYRFMEAPNLRVIEDHDFIGNNGNISFKIGDIFSPLNEAFDPKRLEYALGVNTRTRQKGEVPLCKLKVVVEPLDFDL